MRLFGFRLPFFVAVIWVAIGSTVWALGYNRGRVETVYLGPSTTALRLPTSYVVTTSWVEPTSYVVPTSYATAYVRDPIAVVQPAYVSTAYVRTGLFGRRWLVERPVYASYASTYLPTSYYVPSAYYPTRSYLPTVLTDPVLWPSSYVASADCVCPERLASAASPSRAPSGATTTPSNGSRSIQSEPVDESAMTSNVGPAPVESAPAAAPGASVNSGQGGAATNNPQNGSSATDNTPAAPLIARPPVDQPAQPTTTPAPVKPAPGATKGATGTTNPANTQGGATGRQSLPAPTSAVIPQNQNQPNANTPTPPVAPAAPPPGDPNEPLTSDNNTTGVSRYQARRPAYSTPALRPEIRTVLYGMVQSRAAGDPEEGVRVSVRNAYDPSRDKSTMSDAFGRFSVRLSDGDWTVNVTMPSGRVYAVSDIRVSNGQITDSIGRRVPSLEITR